MLELEIFKNIVNSVTNPKSSQQQQQQQQQQEPQSQSQDKCNKIKTERGRIQEEARKKLKENNEIYLKEGCSEEAQQAFSNLNPLNN